MMGLEEFRHLLFFGMLGAPPLGAILLMVFRKTHAGFWLGSWFLAAVVSYGFMLAAVQATEIHLENVLNTYDLDGNGTFSGRELTPEMELAMQDVTRDTARSLAPFTGLVICPIFSGICHVLLGLPFFLVMGWLRRQRQRAFVAMPYS